MKEYDVIRAGFCIGSSKVPKGSVISLHPGAARYALAHAYIEEHVKPKPVARKKAAAKKKSTTDVKSDSVTD